MPGLLDGHGLLDGTGLLTGAGLGVGSAGAATAPPAGDAWASFAAPDDAALDGPHLTDTVMETVGPAIERAMADWLIALAAEIEAADKTPALLARLERPGALPGPERLTAVMGDALALAALVGRSSVVDEAIEDGLTRAELFGDAFAEPGEIEFRGAPFARAVRFLRDKVAMGTRHWSEVDRAAHDRSFIVSGEIVTDVLEDIRRMLVSTIGGGDGLKEFRRRFRGLLESGKWTGDERLAKSKKLFGWRTRTIWWTNLSSSHAAGRRQQQRELVHVLPFWQYRHGATRSPKRPRVRHLRLDGTTLPADHEIWDRIYAPNGWLCSCAIRAITRTAADRVDPNLREPPTESEIGAAIDHEWQHAPGSDLDEDAI